MPLTTRAAADAFVASLATRTRSSLGPRLAKLNEEHDLRDALAKVKGVSPGEEMAMAWALLRAGLVQAQSPSLWGVLSDQIAAYPSLASPADVELLLSTITDPSAVDGGRVRCMPSWSSALDNICFALCGANLDPLKSLWARASGSLRTGLTSVLVRGGALGREGLDGDWADLLARHFRSEKGFGVAAADAAGKHVWLSWPTHPAAQRAPFAPPHFRRVDLWDQARSGWSPLLQELVAAFTTREAYAQALARS